MQPEILLPRSKDPATSPYALSDESCPHPHNLFFKTHSVFFFHLRL